MMLSRAGVSSSRLALALAAARPSSTVAVAATSYRGDGGDGGGWPLAAAATAAAAALSIPVLAHAATSCEAQTEAVQLFEVDEAERFHRCLAYHQSLLTSYKSRWDWSNAETSVPTTSWPTNVPSDQQVGPLTSDLRYCRRSPNYRNDEDYCDALRFKIGSYWLIHPDPDSQKKGLRIIRDLAERGHPDGMCLYGMCMMDGRGGLDPNPLQAVVWFRLCSDMHSYHPQAAYELGVALYTGEGCAEDEATAARLFRRSADTGHPGAAYMLGDCLLDGVGVVRDRAEALEWLVTAAELGHRGARSRVLAVLGLKEGEDYGKFTDSSRQTLVESVKSTTDAAAAVGDVLPAVPALADAAKTESAQERDVAEGRFENREATFERRYTIGGGARNPVVLARRRTIIQESREA